MKKALAVKRSHELRPEYDLSQLKGGVRGKYYPRATAGMNLVMIEPDLADLFPDSQTVNRALRVLADAAKVLSSRKGRRARIGRTRISGISAAASGGHRIPVKNSSRPVGATPNERRLYLENTMRPEYDFSKGKRGAVVPVPKGKTRITIRLDDDLLDWFRNEVDRAGGGNYQTLINLALKISLAEAGSH